MPYPADLVGKIVDINFETDLRPSVLKGGTPLHGLSAQMDVPVFDYHPPRPGVGGAPPIPERFADTGVPWNIEFLWWYPGENTTCRLQRPVLTGPMSGCYLFRYVSGGPRIVHIGTCEVAQESLRTKQNWKIYVNHTLGQAGSLTVFGNTPLDNAIPDVMELSRRGIMQGVKIFGLFLPDGSAYTLVMQQLLPLRTKLMVHAVRPMPLLPWAALRGNRTWTT